MEPESEGPGLYVKRPDGSMAKLSPGTYAVSVEGKAAPAANWQRAIDEFPWNEGGALIREHMKRGRGETRINLFGMYILVGMTLIAALALGWKGLLDGQALAGFLGAAVGYLLSRANIGE